MVPEWILEWRLVQSNEYTSLKTPLHMYDRGHDTQQKSHSPQPLRHSPRLQDKLREVSYILHILAHNNIDIFFYD